MTGTLGASILATVLFVAAHLILSSLPVRTSLIAVLGETGFRAGYTVQALALLAWVVAAYAEAPVVPVWAPPIGFQHLSLTIMPIALFLLVAGLSTRNPTAVGTDTAASVAAGPVGVFRLTRHPVMWGVALWGLSHLLGNGDAAGMILFAGLTILALVGAGHSDARRLATLGEPWAGYRAQTSFFPLIGIVRRRTGFRFDEIGWVRLFASLALYFILLAAHPWLFGVSPLPGLV